MNIIMPTVPRVYLKNTEHLQQAQMNNFVGYSFTNKSSGLNSTVSGNTSLNNSAISIINAYFGTVNNITTTTTTTTTTKKNVLVLGEVSVSALARGNNSSCSFFISKPNFSYTNSKVTIQFFYYTSSNTDTNSKTSFHNEVGSFRKNFSDLSITLAQLYQKEVNVISTRLYYPYLNSDILCQYLAYNAPSNTFMDFQEAILTSPSLHKTNLPAHIHGIKVQLSGRLVTETVIPRITVKSCLIGSFQTQGATNNTVLSQACIDYSKFTTKNELGAFTVKVWICQRS